MKNLKFCAIAALSIVTIIISSCGKSNIQEQLYIGDTINEEIDEKALWPPTINVDITFEPIRLARTKSTPNHSGRICDCDECFGLCNRPVGQNDSGATIAIERTSPDKGILYILKSLPSNFEPEFGVDETFELKNDLNEVLYTIKTGVYNAVQEEGVLHCLSDNKNYSYFVKVEVDLE